jgi:hypothetical protein
MLKCVFLLVAVLLLIAPFCLGPFLEDDLFYYMEILSARGLVLLLAIVVLYNTPKYELSVILMTISVVIVNLFVFSNLLSIAIEDNQKETFHLVGAEGEYQR